MKLLTGLLPLFSTRQHCNKHQRYLAYTMAITRSKSSQSIEATMTAALYELPNELIYTIVGFIKDRETLCAFAQVSKHCQEFAEASIYRAVLVRQSSDAYSIKKAIQKRPQRASHIHTINLRAAWYHKRRGLGYHMRFILSKCPNLQDLAVESPTCNYGRLMSSPDDTWRLEEQRILSGLKTKDKSSHLTKMTLELDGIQDRYWDPNQLGNADYCWGQVMALPTLTELKVSCALIHDNIKMAEPRSTRLKILELIECNISFEGLRRILCGPKALQRLHLGTKTLRCISTETLIMNMQVRMHGMEVRATIWFRYIIIIHSMVFSHSIPKPSSTHCLSRAHH